MTIRVHTPVRIDLSGGTVDISQLNAFFYPQIMSTINIAVGLENVVEINKLESSAIEIYSADLDQHLEFEGLSSLRSYLGEKKPGLELILKAVDYMGIEGIKLTTRVDAPHGSGLGASSSLIIAVLRGLNQISTRIKADEFVKVAQFLETSVLKIPTGCQDYIAAISGGCNHIKYLPSGTRIERLPLTPRLTNEMNKKMRLFYLGKPDRFSSPINNPNWKVFRNTVEEFEKMKPIFVGIERCTQEIREAVSREDIDKLAVSMDEEMRLRSALHPSILPDNLMLTELNELGARAKICGAGGGGTLVVFTDSTDSIREYMSNWGAIELGYSIQHQGIRVEDTGEHAKFIN